MKRINLTENDIFNIVNRVITEQGTKKEPKPLTPDELKKRFLYGYFNGVSKVTGKINEEFIITEKRGLTKESFTFIVQDLEFITSSKGPSAIIKGYVKGQSSDPSQQTILEYICNSYGDFVLREYEGLDENDIKKQKTPKVKSDVDGNFKSNVKQGFDNVKDKFQDVRQNTKLGIQNAKQGIQNLKRGMIK